MANGKITLLNIGFYPRPVWWMEILFHYRLEQRQVGETCQA
jgi:hypothetical protein